MIEPELAAGAILGLICLAILASVAQLLSWVHTTVYPEMWKVDEQFGRAPSKAEVLCCKATGMAALGLRLLLFGIIVSLFF